MLGPAPALVERVDQLAAHEDGQQIAVGFDRLALSSSQRRRLGFGYVQATHALIRGSVATIRYGRPYTAASQLSPCRRRGRTGPSMLWRAEPRGRSLGVHSRQL